MNSGYPAAALALALWFPTAAAGETSGPAPAATNRAIRTVPVTSHQRNFIVTGMPGTDALEVAVWAEKTKQAFESLAGARAPARRIYPVIISAEQQHEVKRGWVRGIQQVTGEGNLRQELVMVNPSLVDQEDVLELLCRLLLDRWVFARMGRMEGAPVPVMPDWLAVGFAQQLYPELRARNLRELQDISARQEKKPEASAVFEWSHFPSGRWPEKVLAGMVLEWMKERIPLHDLVEYMADKIAGGLVPQAEAIASLCGYTGLRDFNMGFDVWLVRQKTRLIPGMDSSGLAGVEELLALPAAPLGLIWPGGDGPPLTPELLVARRNEPWVRAVARTARVKLGLALVSQPAELTQALDGCIKFFAALGQGQRQFSDDELLSQWRHGEAGLAQYKAGRRQIGALLDRNLLPPFTVAPENRAALEAMLDRWESAPASDGAIKP